MQGVQFGPSYHFATLPAEQDGRLIYCDNCSQTSPITGSGAGTLLLGIGGAWTAFGAPSGGGGGGGTPPISTHTLTETAGAATLAVNSSSVPATDINYLTLNANATITTPPASGLADGEQVSLEAIEPSSQSYTVGFNPGSGVTLLDDTRGGVNTNVGAGCQPPTGGLNWYEFQYSSGVLHLFRCNSNPSNPAPAGIHGIQVMESGNPQAGINLPTICPFQLTFPANFTGSGTYASCGGSPTETDSYNVLINGVQAGTVSINTSCVASFATTGSVKQVCTPGQRIVVQVPTLVSGTDISFTLGASSP